jgi:hypothetical protein
METTDIWSSHYNHIRNIQESENWLQKNSPLLNKVNDLIFAYDEIYDIIPQYIGKLGSGHIFPYIESVNEIKNSFQLAKLGFYKQSFIGLRNALELGLLSIYWDKDDEAEKAIQSWYKSHENTPFKKKILSGLLTITNVSIFENQFKIKERVENAYNILSDFIHTRGYLYSSQKLNNGNTIRFNATAIKQWIHELDNIIQIVVTMHVLKHPIALQIVPVEEKFGINEPIGVFLEPYQVDRVKKILDRKQLDFLQKISDNDEEVKELVLWINSLPDLTPSDLQAQFRDFKEMVPPKKRDDEYKIG